MNTMNVSIKQKHAYYMFVVLLYYFLLRDFLEQRISVFSYTDEIIAVFVLPVFPPKVYGIR